jgi:diaminohydroxyphosphoribosylaminopyrimidine deaminase/5-amino-6-(5-phosphoribosylamino)uracil reductase
MPFTAIDHHHMRRAIELAWLGRFSTHPNPRVGCVIAQGERIVGEGWHRQAGQAHAEVLALRAAGDAAKGATAYVTLEPHGFHGKTPPCTEALIRAGIVRVVCAVLDPNPKVHGDGIRQLQQAGVRCDVGLLAEDAAALNRGFDQRMRTGLPRVTVKVAATLDGRTALANGASQWITGEAARADVQRLRAAASAIVTGVQTVIADDPQLNVRDASLDLAGRAPLRVILDTQLRTSPAAKVFSTQGGVIVATACDDATRAEALRGAGAEVLRVGADAQGRVSLPEVLRELGRRECNDVLVEAGSELSGEIIAQGLCDELIVYLAPKLFGPDARPLFALPALQRVQDSLQFQFLGAEPIGPDLKLTLMRV